MPKWAAGAVGLACRDEVVAAAGHAGRHASPVAASMRREVTGIGVSCGYGVDASWRRDIDAS